MDFLFGVYMVLAQPRVDQIDSRCVVAGRIEVDLGADDLDCGSEFETALGFEPYDLKLTVLSTDK